MESGPRRYKTLQQVYIDTHQVNSNIEVCQLSEEEPKTFKEVIQDEV